MLTTRSRQPGTDTVGRICCQIPSRRLLSDCTARRAHLGITAFPARSLGPIPSAAFRWCCLRPSPSGIHGTVSWDRCQVSSHLRPQEQCAKVSNEYLRPEEYGSPVVGVGKEVAGHRTNRTYLRKRPFRH